MLVIAALFLTLSVCTLDAATARPDMSYFSIDGNKIKVHGLYGFSYEVLNYRRLDPSLNHFRPALAWQFIYPKGGRIRFKTNTSRLHVLTEILKMPELPETGSMNRLAARGIDVYVNGGFVDTLLIEEDNVLAYPQSDPPVMREVELYLPCLTAIRIEKIGVDKGAVIEAPNTLNKSVVFYGTSIEWGGGGVSRMSLTYPEVLSRSLGFDVYNFGFRGNAWGEDEIADTLSQVPADVFVLSYLTNVDNEALTYTGKSYYQNVVSFVDKIKYYQPGSKVIVVSPYFSLKELYNSSSKKTAETKRKACKQAADDLSEKYTGIFYFDGKRAPFHNASSDAFGEPVHPNNLGHTQIANLLRPLLIQALSSP